MTQKQIDYLNKIHQEMLSSPEDKFLTGAKYKNGKQYLDAHDLSFDQWTEFCLLGNQDQDLWTAASNYLSNL